MSFFYADQDQFTNDITLHILFKYNNAEYREMTDNFFLVCKPDPEEMKLCPNKIPDDMPAIDVYVNIIGLLAMNLCKNKDSCYAIQELYQRYEDLMLKIASESLIIQSLGVFKFLLPGEQIIYYKMALCLLEACTEPLQEKNDEEVCKYITETGKFFLRKPSICIAATCSLDIESSIKEDITKELLRICKKYNNAISREVKRTGTYNIEEKGFSAAKNIQQFIKKNQIAPSVSRLSMALDMSASVFIGPSIDNYIYDLSTLMDYFYLAITPMAISIDCVYTDISNKAFTQEAEIRERINNKFCQFMFMANDINCHSTPSLLDSLFHISGSGDTVERYLAPGAKNIDEDSLKKIITMLATDSERNFEHADEATQDMIVELCCYIIIISKSYQRFVEMHNESLNFDTMSKIHFRNSQEEKYERMISDFKTEIGSLKSTVVEKEQFFTESKERLVNEIEQLEIENKRLKQQLTENSANKKELLALREYAFRSKNQQENDSDKVDVQEIFEEISQKKVVVIGGHPGWITKMKEKLPAWNYIPIGSNNFPKNMLENADLVVLVTKFCKHSMYYRVISAIENSNTDLMFLNEVNIELSVRAIQQHIKGGE